ncbi:MAG TPA: GFA family protein [Candidatus Binataceae bacterium]|nr:GFA family protein [Candidatus Binataceae bacterium]
MAQTMTGGCACGAIRYEARGEPIFTANCYCRDCQRCTGTAVTSVLVFPLYAVAITGEARYFVVGGDTGNLVNRGFCANCGSPLFTRPELLPDAIAIKAASLDDPNQFSPQMECYVDSAPSWATLTAGVTKFHKAPELPG